MLMVLAVTRTSVNTTTVQMEATRYLYVAHMDN